MWLRHCFQEQTPVGTAYEKNIVDNLRATAGKRWMLRELPHYF